MNCSPNQICNASDGIFVNTIVKRDHVASKIDGTCPNEDLFIMQILLKDVYRGCFFIVAQNISERAPI